MHITLIGVPPPKIDQKPIENRSEIDPKTVPNLSKIGPRSASEPTSLPTSILDRFGTVFGPFWALSWRPLGGLSGAKLGSSWSKNWFLEVLDGVQKRTWCWIPFWTDFWSVLGRFWVPKSTQNRSRIGLKSEQAKKQKSLKNLVFFNVFCASEGWKIDKKSIKIGS